MDNEPKRHMRVWRISIVAGVVSCALVVLFLFYETISGNASEKLTMESTLEGVLEILCQSFIIYKIGLNHVREIRL